MKALIIGFGRAGRRQGQLLTKLGIDWVYFDPNLCIMDTPPGTGRVTLGLKDPTFEQILSIRDYAIAVICTPPHLHLEQITQCLDAGLWVLCEKPLAVSVQEAKGMIAASRRTNTCLAVGMVRRLDLSSQLLKRFIASGILGEILHFDVQEGSQFGWPLRTLHTFV